MRCGPYTTWTFCIDLGKRSFQRKKKRNRKYSDKPSEINEKYKNLAKTKLST